MTNDHRDFGGEPTRRSILKGTAALVALPLIGVVSCSGTRQRQSGAANSAGGKNVLTIGEFAQLTSLDREFEIGEGSFEAMYNVYEPLVEFRRVPFEGSDGSYYLDYDPKNWELRALAEEPSVSEDGLTWTLRFKKGVKSHAGNDLTAHDFAYSIQRHQNLWSLGSFYNLVAGLTPRRRQSWSIVDEQTLTVKTRTPSPLFRVLLENNAAFGLFDSKAARAHATKSDPWSKKWIERHGDKAGHGAYTVKSNIAGKETVFSSFPDYYRGEPKIGQVSAKVVSNQSSAVTLLRGGGIQLIRNLLPEQYEALKNVPGVVIDNFDKGKFLLLFMMLNNKQEPFNNKAVRQAIAWATPYEEIVQGIYRGYASRWNGIISRDYPGFDETAWPYGKGADVDKARRLLRDAGIDKLPSIELMYSTSQPIHAQVAQQLQTSLKEIELPITLKNYSDATFTTRLTGHQYQAAVWQDLALTPDIGYAIDLYFLSDAAVNVMQYHSPAADKLSNAILTTLDETKRGELASQLQKLILQDSPAIFLAQPHYVVARQENVKGVTAAPSRALQFYDMSVE